METKAPAFQFYPADHLASARTTMMSLREEGAYLRALLYCWRHGSIPADPKRLAKLIGKGCTISVATMVASMFLPCAEDSTQLVHDRLDSEREKQRDWRKKSSEGGKKSAASRAKAKAAQVDEGCLANGSTKRRTRRSSSASSTSTSEETGEDTRTVPSEDERVSKAPVEPAPVDDEESTVSDRSNDKLAGFDEFWAEYPRKESKGAAERAWMKGNCARLLDEILDGVEFARHSPRWCKNGGQYIPHPAKWLNDRGWEDEIAAVQSAPESHREKAGESQAPREDAPSSYPRPENNLGYGPRFDDDMLSMAHPEIQRAFAMANGTYVPDEYDDQPINNEPVDGPW